MATSISRIFKHIHCVFKLDTKSYFKNILKKEKSWTFLEYKWIRYSVGSVVAKLIKQLETV